jgi:hypothetical protein
VADEVKALLPDELIVGARTEHPEAVDLTADFGQDRTIY